jgi:MoxR-like ATPase
VIGQTEAVDLVVDLLAVVKAALNRPRKPIASLLFIGPTGVGKTEMAKALAEYLFGSRDRLTRFDMSEFADPLSVQRLIGGVLTSEGVLTARVREQPFSVILLDEVEKAHPQLFDLLLQVLGEGRLTDAAGRLADFCNSVVIMTSNLGADSYLQGDFGLVAGQPTAQRAREHFVREVEKALRPEMVNRIDRIVPFAPLDPSVIQQIAKRQLDLLRHRDGIRYRGVTIEESADLIAWLAKKGYDARYGARPLKRAIEREVLAPLAAQMNTYTTDTALTVRLRLHENLPHVQVRARTDPTGQMVAVGGPQQEEVQVARNTVQLRRSLQKLNSCSALIEVHNEIFRMEKAQNRAHAYDPKLASLTRLRDDIHSATAEAVAQEDEVLMRLHGQAAGPGTGLLPLGKKVEEGLARFDQLVLSLYLRQFDEANRISLVVFSEDQATVFALAWAYYRLALAARCRASIWQITPPRIDRSAQRTEEVKKFEHLFELPERRLLLQADDVFTDKPTVSVRIWVPWRKTFQEEVANVSRTKGVIGLGLELQGEAVYPRYAPEEGLHHFQTPRHSSKALVVTDTNPMTELTFPEGIDRRGAIGSQPRRRLYRLEQGGAEDSRLGWQNLPNLALEAVVSHCLESTLKLAAAEVLQS